jgi:TRAP transporter 4TM/12TM fusion protein
MADSSNVNELLIKFFKAMAVLAALALPLVSIFGLIVFVMDPWLLRIIHVSLAGIVIFSLDSCKNGNKYPFYKHLINLLCVLAAIATTLYIIIDLKRLQIAYQTYPTTVDFIISAVIVVLVLEMTRKTLGLVLPIIALSFICYGLFGHLLPPPLQHPGMSIERLFGWIVYQDGIYGSAVQVSVSWIMIFLVFSSFYRISGAGDVFFQLSQALVGRFRGGPAKIAVIASSLFGTISGAPTANVVATGTFTIPLMKSTGWSPVMAGAIEAAASTGGLIMPPIMGAGAFVLAEIVGLPYSQIAIAAILPAILYYLSVFLSVDLEAAKLGLKGLPKEEVPDIVSVLKSGWLKLIPIVGLIVFIFVLRYSIFLSVIYTILLTLVISWISRSSVTLTPSKIVEGLISAGQDVKGVAAACATAGIVVAVVGATGLSQSFGYLVMGLARDNLWIAAILAMLLTIVVGMGVPAVAAYIVASMVVSTSLVNMGIDPLNAHMFIFWFACMAGLTPPVCVTSFVAAGVAGSDNWATALNAFKMVIPAFLVPLLILINNDILLMGDFWGIAVTFISAAVGVAAMANGLWRNNEHLILRGILILSGLLLIHLDNLTNILGLVGIIAVVGIKYVLNRRKQQAA